MGKESTGVEYVIEYAGEGSISFSGGSVGSLLAGKAPAYVVAVVDSDGESGDKRRVYFKTTIENSTGNPYRVSLYLASTTGSGTVGVYSDYGGSDGSGYKAPISVGSIPDYVAPSKEWTSWSDNTNNVPVIRNIDVPAGGDREVAWFLEAASENALKAITLNGLMCLNN